MKRFLSKIGIVSLMVVFAIISLSFSAQAEKKKITISAKRPPGDISQTTVYPGDVPNHELVQLITSYNLTSSEPDFNGKTLHHDQADDVAGTGSHRGYVTWFLKNGDEVYSIVVFYKPR
jgi:hypothetical protein